MKRRNFGRTEAGLVLTMRRALEVGNKRRNVNEKDLHSPSIETQYIFLKSRFFENHRSLRCQ